MKVSRHYLSHREAIRHGLYDINARPAPHVEEERPRAVLTELQQLTVHQELGYFQPTITREISARCERKSCRALNGRT